MCLTAAEAVDSGGRLTACSECCPAALRPSGAPDVRQYAAILYSADDLLPQRRTGPRSVVAFETTARSQPSGRNKKHMTAAGAERERTAGGALAGAAAGRSYVVTCVSLFQ